MSFKNLEGETGPAGPARSATDTGGPPVTAPAAAATGEAATAEAATAEAATAEAAAAAPGTPENPLRITDPRAMRALAHPARIAILQHLVLDGPATATECAAVAGLSPSACSYHLRALARHGFVAEDPASAADGRHRPWRARVVAITFGQDPGQPDAVRTAGRLLAESLQARVGEIRAQYLDRQSEYPPEWRDAARMSQDVVHVTVDELTAVRAELQAVLARYRRLDPAGRPAEARRVHALIDVVPWFDPPAGDQ
jgi:DNA-binding transcriptional ArsR family regulator